MKTKLLPLCLLIYVSCSRLEVVDPHIELSNNVLKPTVVFDTKEEGDVFVEYWRADGSRKRQTSMASHGTVHRITLLNLKPVTPYKYVVVNTTSGRTSREFDFTTGELFSDVPVAMTKVKIDTTQLKGYILFRGWAPSGCDVLIDSEGDVVWYHQYDNMVRRPFAWTSNQTVLSMYDTAQIVEYDLYGNRKLNLKLEDRGIDNLLHHDLVYDKAGQIVTLTHDSTEMDLRKFGGKQKQYLRADGILVLDTAGNVKWKWNLLDVFDPKTLPEKIDPTHSLGHANSISIADDGNYLVSFRDFSQVWKIDSKSGAIIWKLGKGGDFALDEEYYFMRQHSVYQTRDGAIMIFDNGDRRTRPFSRILAFHLNEKEMKAEVTVNVKLSSDLSADKMCSAEEIEKGKYLVCTSKRSGILSVVDDAGNELWRVDTTYPSYRAYFVKNPFVVPGR